MDKKFSRQVRRWRKGRRMDEDFSEDDVLKFLTSLSPAEMLTVRQVMQQLAEEIVETQNEGNDVLFCGSNGAYIVKCLHYSRDALGYDEPQQLPSANEFVLLFACSNEFIDEKAQEIRDVFTDPVDQQEQWEKYLNSLAMELGNNSAKIKGFDTLLENE